MSNTSSSSLYSSEQNGSFDLSMLLMRLWEGKWIIILFVTVSLLLGGVHLSRQIAQYQSEILLQIKPSRQSAGVVGQLMPTFPLGGGGNNQQATQIALIKSRYILEPVVKQLGLDIHVAPIQSWMMKLFSPSHATVEVKQFDIPSQYINKAFTLIIEKDNGFSLYTANNSLILHGEVGKLATNYDKRISLRVSAVDASPNTKFLLTKGWDANVVSALQGQLDISDLGVKAQTGILVLKLRDANPEKLVLVLNAIGKVVQDKNAQNNATEASKTLDFLYKQLPITKHDLEESELELNRYRSKSGKFDVKFQGTHFLRQLTAIDKQLSELKIDKLDKLQRYTVEHPYIISLNIKISELLMAQEKLESRLKKLPASDQIAVNLMRDVKVKNDLYMVLLNKIQELQVIKAGIVSDVRILSLAQLAHNPLPQNRRVVYFISLLLGLLLSGLLLFTRKLMFPCVEDPHWSEKHCDLVNLAVIPFSKEQFSDNTKLKNKTLKQMLLLAHVNPRNLAIESLRSLRTTLQIRLVGTSNKIVSILGVSPGVGKTFVSANLAYLLATVGKRVVLIDTDMRRGTLHKYFNLPPGPGLSEVLNGKKKLSEVLIPTIHENLIIVSRGTYPDDPSELLASERFKDTLDQLAEQFDIVVVDTPPILLVTDAALISVHAGTNYLVVGSGAHQPREIEMSINRLTNVGAVLHGSIFNYYKEGGIQNTYYKYGSKYSYYYDDRESVKP